ncbi:MAG: hypothetical protein ACK5NW_08945 [Ottowia sp.]
MFFLLAGMVGMTQAQTTYEVDLSVPFDTPTLLGGSGITYTLTLASAQDSGVVPLTGFFASNTARWSNGDFVLTSDGTSPTAPHHGFTVIFSAPGTITVTNIDDASRNGGGMWVDRWRLTGDAGTWSYVNAGQIDVTATPTGTSISGTQMELDWVNGTAFNSPWGSVSLAGGSAITIRTITTASKSGGKLLFTTAAATATAGAHAVPTMDGLALSLLAMLMGAAGAGWLARRRD